MSGLKNKTSGELCFGSGEGGAWLIINKLKNAGYSCYFVGGCVRNALLELPISDIDLACDALPDDIKRVFCDYPLDLKGERFGTVGVIVDKIEYEITSFRREGDYKALRKPAVVSFNADLKSDAIRRDFTCNAMYYGECGLIDFFGGENDARKKILRAVGEPEARFKEDALRVLRALRFCSCFGFEIEEFTKTALFKCKSGIKSLSSERVFGELKKILLGDYFGKTLEKYFAVFNEALPELAASGAGSELLKRIEFSEKNFCVRFALLFLNFFGASGADEKFKDENSVCERAAGALKRLKADKRSAQIILGILKNENTCFSSEKQIKNALFSLGEELCRAVLSYKFACAKSDEERAKIKEQKQALNNVVLSGVYSLKGLAVSGNDLLKLKISGEQVGELLNALLAAVINGEAQNDKAILMSLAEKLIKNDDR